MSRRVKTKRIRQGKSVSEDEARVKNIIIILFIVVVACLGIYFLSESMINKEKSKEQELQDVEIKYDIATIGTMFNRIEEEYYVLLYSNKEDGNELNSLLDSYRSKDDYVKTYYIDLDRKINSIAIGDKLVKEPKNSSEVKVKGATLYKIKNAKVVECISSLEEIKEFLEG